MNHPAKRILFKYYALVASSAFVGVILLFVFGLLSWEEFAGIAAGAFAFAFGVQKQNLAETKLFNKLFEQFNRRYDKMDADMNRIFRDAESPLTEAEIKMLYKYFNLCGEEFLYYEKGFICGEVWRAWKNGMKFYRQNPRIRKLWDDDLGNDSYYGLKF